MHPTFYFFVYFFCLTFLVFHPFSNNSLWIIILQFTTKDVRIKLKKTKSNNTLETRFLPVGLNLMSVEIPFFVRKALK